MGRAELKSNILGLVKYAMAIAIVERIEVRDCLCGLLKILVSVTR